MKQRTHPTLPLVVELSGEGCPKYHIKDSQGWIVTAVVGEYQLKALGFVEEKKEESDTDYSWIANR